MMSDAVGTRGGVKEGGRGGGGFKGGECERSIVHRDIDGLGTIGVMSQYD